MHLKTIFLTTTVAIFLSSCAKVNTAKKDIEVVLKGEMLFSGPNSLQAGVLTTIDELTNELNLPENSLSSIGIGEISIHMSEEHAALCESLLLQIVSNNHEMTTLGTLSPLPEGNSFALGLAEDIDLLPFITDVGATWVLDVNLREDVLDEMTASAAIKLNVNHKEN